jgi:hypothetical protein
VDVVHNSLGWRLLKVPEGNMRVKLVVQFKATQACRQEARSELPNCGINGTV